ncbi:MAG: hypothetical protein AAGJ08_24970 [Cyanobacteria bacterium P01_H01_bin.35]
MSNMAFFYFLLKRSLVSRKKTRAIANFFQVISRRSQETGVRSQNEERIC